jgi:hypothetical protein
VFLDRIEEADDFYSFAPVTLSDDARMVQRQAFAGLLWNKQFYHYVVEEWLKGDPAMPPPPPERLLGRNRAWIHVYNDDVLSMPDKWEYPWFAAWDLAFHTIPLAMVDPDFAKQQLSLLLREWYQSPNGQLPAYEWEFSDVNPPVHPWACWRVYKIDGKLSGKAGRRVPGVLLSQAADELHLVGEPQGLAGQQHFRRRLSRAGQHRRLRSQQAASHRRLYRASRRHRLDGHVLPDHAAHRDRADAARQILRRHREQIFRAFSLHRERHESAGRRRLWDEEDGFFYDRLRMPDGRGIPMRLRSLVGLIPLFAVTTLDAEAIDRMPGFKRRMNWFIKHRADLCLNIASITRPGQDERTLLSLVPLRASQRVLQIMLDENEFLSPYGIRGISRYHKDHPFVLRADGQEYSVMYEPAESTTNLFGGNSNWRGPVWFPVNYLMIESLQRFHHYFGDQLQVEFPTGSGVKMNLAEVACQLSRRYRICSCAMSVAAGRYSAARRNSSAIRTSAITSSSTSTSRATMAPGWARAIKPAGRRWWPSCCNKAASKHLFA